MNFTTDVVIGLEIHVGLNTKSKLFCSCENKTGEPNEHTCPICLGHPGSKPTLNKEAVEKSIRLAQALHCKIAPQLIFSRKTYFYPDLTKNFQTTQYEEPLGKEGYLIVQGEKIGIERIHIEEDPGALLHKEGHVLIDYNRSGTPLCEIVTKPEIASAKKARETVKKLLTLLNYIDSYEEGILKADLNISIKETNYKRVEIKGVSGHKDIEDALVYEITRQQEAPEEVKTETRGYDAEQKYTYSQRSKESEDDYGYIYEPDLAIRELPEEYIKKVTASMPSMPDERITKYLKEGMKQEDAETIASTKIVADLFEEAVKKGTPYEFTAKFFRRDIISRLNDDTFSEEDIKEVHEQITKIISMLHERKIHFQSSRQIITALAQDKKIDVHKYAEEKNLLVDDNFDLETLCAQAIKESEKAVEEYKEGNEKALNYIVGQVMKATKGQAMPDEIKNTLKKLLH